MRIIAGKYRRRKLRTNPGLTTRPITDRVKEHLFEFLRREIEGRRVCDLFAGTGTLGLEALSRDAAGAVFIERDRHAFELLQKNVADLGIDHEALCWRADVLRCSFVPKGVDHLLPYDIIFFDPPYRMVPQITPGTPLYKSLERLTRPHVSSPAALLLVRTSEGETFQCPPEWKLDRVMEISSMEIHWFRKSGDQVDE